MPNVRTLISLRDVSAIQVRSFMLIPPIVPILRITHPAHSNSIQSMTHSIGRQIHLPATGLLSNHFNQIAHGPCME
jgi:hypothetical protein